VKTMRWAVRPLFSHSSDKAAAVENFFFEVHVSLLVPRRQLKPAGLMWEKAAPEIYGPAATRQTSSGVTATTPTWRTLAAAAKLPTSLACTKSAPPATAIVAAAKKYRRAGAVEDFEHLVRR
jgi:hypothetical protein